MIKKKLAILSSIGLVFAPLSVFAAGPACGNYSQNTIEYILCRIGSILNTVVPILIALGVVYFVWGVVQYIMGHEEESKKKGREKMIWGIIGLVVIVAMWGIVGIIQNSFGVSGTYQGTIPCVPIPPNTTC
jgi:uncharacterized membrane protein YidH (DUF202 family)